MLTADTAAWTRQMAIVKGLCLQRAVVAIGYRRGLFSALRLAKGIADVITVTPRDLSPSTRATELHSVRIVDRLEEQIGAIREKWNAFSWHRLEADLDFYMAFLRSRTNAQPFIVIVEERNQPVAMIMARLEKTRLELNFGYKTILSQKVRAITVVPGGVADATESTSQAIVDELINFLAQSDADVVILPALRRDSDLYAAATTSPSFFCRQHIARSSSRWRLSLPNSMEEFLQSRGKRTRESMRRYAKRLRRDFGDSVSVAVIRESDDLDQLFADIESVASKTYQRGLGVALQDTPEQRRLMSMGFRHGWFRIYFLSIAGLPVAFWPGYAYAGTFFIGTPGYDPAYSEYRVGMYLLMAMIEDLCVDPNFHTVDYGSMEGEYKRRFGSENWKESDVLIFAPSVRGFTINALRTLILSAERTAKTVLIKTGLLGRVRREWKRRLAPPQQDQ